VAPLKRGNAQRVRALNAFLRDVYGDQRILHDGKIPWQLVYIHVCGIDLIRGRDGTAYCLEDNVRTPSGLSCVLENREALKRSFPKLFEHDALRYSAAIGMSDPTIVLLAPDIYNSAYFEHTVRAKGACKSVAHFAPCQHSKNAASQVATEQQLRRPPSARVTRSRSSSFMAGRNRSMRGNR